MSRQKIEAAKASGFLAGAKAGVPVALGGFTYGIAFGILARQVGLSLLEAGAMSVLVYAGTAQLIAIGMLQAGQTVGAIVATTFLVNIRYLLLCAALAPYLSKWKFFERMALGYYVSDESFAVISTRFSSGNTSKADAFGVNTLIALGWVVSSIVGYVGSEVVPGTEKYGLDYALPAVFIGLLAILIQNRTMLIVSIVGGVLAVLGYLIDLKGFEVLVACVLAATCGLGIRLLQT